MAAPLAAAVAPALAVVAGFVGRSYNYTVETEGELKLGYNDNAFSDNAGEFVAEVVVERARR